MYFEYRYAIFHVSKTFAFLYCERLQVIAFKLSRVSNFSACRITSGLCRLYKKPGENLQKPLENFTAFCILNVCKVIQVFFTCSSCSSFYRPYKNPEGNLKVLVISSKLSYVNIFACSSCSSFYRLYKKPKENLKQVLVRLYKSGYVSVFVRSHSGFCRFCKKAEPRKAFKNFQKLSCNQPKYKKNQNTILEPIIAFEAGCAT